MSNNEDTKDAEAVEVVSSKVDVPLSPEQELCQAGYHLQKETATPPVVFNKTATPAKIRKLYDIQRAKETAACGAGLLPVTGLFMMWVSQTAVDLLDGSLLVPWLGYYGIAFLLASPLLYKLGLSPSKLEASLARGVLPDKQAANLVQVNQKKRRWMVVAAFLSSLAAPLSGFSIPVAVGVTAMSMLAFRCLMLPWKDEPRHPKLQGSVKDAVLSLALIVATLLTATTVSVSVAAVLFFSIFIVARLVQDAKERPAAPLLEGDNDRPRLTGK